MLVLSLRGKNGGGKRGLGQGSDTTLAETPYPCHLTFLSSFLPARLSVMTRLSDSSWAAICKVQGREGGHFLYFPCHSLLCPGPNSSGLEVAKEGQGGAR